MSEEWKSIPSAPGWEASSEGRLRATMRVSMPNGGIKILNVFATFGILDAKVGRFKQSVYNKTRWVSSLICEAFHGPRPTPQYECMHLDEDSLNNKASNLAWGTKSENQTAPKLSISRKKRLRQSNPRKRIPDHDLVQLHAMRCEISAQEIMTKYGVGSATAKRIIAGKYRRLANV